MSRGKYLSLEEARKSKKQIQRFAEEHPSEGDRTLFEKLTDAMCGKSRTKPEDEET